MDIRETTVSVSAIDGQNALLMVWENQIDSRDVRTAFQNITSALSETDTPLYVVVDLQKNPQFPILDTVMEGIKPYRNKMLAEWLVVAPSWAARTIGKSLSAISGRNNVRWFDTLDEALSYLTEMSNLTLEIRE